MSERYQQIVGKIQEAYNAHRAPELWGTPEVSPGFFERLRTDGSRSAWNYLVDQERALGDPAAIPEVKAIANLAGSTLLVLGVREMSEVSEEELHEAECVPSIRQRVGEAAFNITLRLLFFAQDGSGTLDTLDESCLDEHTKEGLRIYDIMLEDGQDPKEVERKRKAYLKRHISRLKR